jgi:hypothetical protein
LITVEELERRPTSAISEAQLEQGGLGVRRPRWLTEQCACGGVIQAEDDDPAIMAAVAVHNASTAHTHWAIATGFRFGRSRPGGR